MKQNQKVLRKWNGENQWKLITQVQFKYCIQIDYFKLKIRKINENEQLTEVYDGELPFYNIFRFSFGLLRRPWFRTGWCNLTRSRIGLIAAGMNIRLHGKLLQTCCYLGNIIVTWFSTFFELRCWKQFDWSLCQNMVLTIRSHWMTWNVDIIILTYLFYN